MARGVPKLVDFRDMLAEAENPQKITVRMAVSPRTIAILNKGGNGDCAGHLLPCDQNWDFVQGYLGYVNS